MCYSTARLLFFKYFNEAGIDNKGYTLHCLRHTMPRELLNAGMRLEVLQQLFGHQDIEVTRRYARLTDRTREEEYFRAMALIEKEESVETTDRYRRSLKRKNYSPHTVKSYMNILANFAGWLQCPS